VVAANSSTRLDGDRRARSNSAFDGDPATAWIAETGPQSGEWLSANLSEPVTFDHLDLQVLNDGRHSLPSVITISTPTASRTVQLSDPPVGYGRAANSVSRIAVDFPALTGSSVRVTVDTVHQVRALDYYSTYAGLTDILPVGLAEVGLPGVSQPAAPAEIPSTCTGGLISIDGHPVDVEVAGSVGDALDGGQLHLQACGDSLDGVSLGPGRHTVVTSLRLPLGWSVDQLWLSSAAGGMAATPAATLAVGGTSPTPALTVTGSSRTSTTVTVEGNGQPFWLVLGQSFSSGFTAAVRGGPNLGGPHLIDAYANGWLVPASAVPAGRTVTIDIDWAPQQVIWAAIGVSGAGLGASVLLAVWPERWGRPRRRRRVPAERGVPASARPRAVTRRSVLGLEVTAVAGWRRLLITAAAWGLVAAAVSRPLIGAVAALAVVIGGRVRSGRVLLRLAAVGLLVGLVWYSVDQQVHRHYWPSIEWPADMGAANALAWWALALLGSDLVCAWVRAAARSGGEG
jgi:hypothetical protein